MLRNKSKRYVIQPYRKVTLCLAMVPVNTSRRAFAGSDFHVAERHTHVIIATMRWKLII
jgi:hypothetical protein